MKKISYEEYEKAQSIVRKFEYQQNPTIQVSVKYKGTIDCCVRVPADWDVEKIKEELSDGIPLNLSRDDQDKIKYDEIVQLIVDGEYKIK